MERLITLPIYRDGYLFSESDELAFGQPVYSDDRGGFVHLCLIVLIKHLLLLFQGINLTLKEQGIRRAAYEDGPIVQQKDADRRFALGIIEQILMIKLMASSHVKLYLSFCYALFL